MNVVSHACQGNQTFQLFKLRTRTIDKSCVQVSDRAVQYVMAIVNHQGVQSMSSNGAGLLDFKGIATPCRDIMMEKRHVHQDNLVVIDDRCARSRRTALVKLK